MCTPIISSVNVQGSKCTEALTEALIILSFGLLSQRSSFADMGPSNLSSIVLLLGAYVDGIVYFLPFTECRRTEDGDGRAEASGGSGERSAGEEEEGHRR